MARFGPDKTVEANLLLGWACEIGCNFRVAGCLKTKIREAEGWDRDSQRTSTEPVYK
jgi:hypothetical protein